MPTAPAATAPDDDHHHPTTAMATAQTDQRPHHRRALNLPLRKHVPADDANQPKQNAAPTHHQTPQPSDRAAHPTAYSAKTNHAPTPSPQGPHLPREQPARQPHDHHEPRREALREDQRKPPPSEPAVHPTEQHAKTKKAATPRPHRYHRQLDLRRENHCWEPLKTRRSHLSSEDRTHLVEPHQRNCAKVQATPLRQPHPQWKPVHHEAQCPLPKSLRSHQPSEDHPRRIQPRRRKPAEAQTPHLRQPRHQTTVPPETQCQQPLKTRLPHHPSENHTHLTKPH